MAKANNYKVKYTEEGKAKLRYINVSYQPSDRKIYTFRTNDKDISEGDMVVVPTDTRWGMTVCKVTEIDITKPSMIVKEIIDRVRV